MEQTVRVHDCGQDGTARVIHIRQSACSGDCHKCSGCGAAKETIMFSVRNPIDAKPGDLVRITANSGSVLKAAAVLYLLPVFLMIAGYLLLMSQNLGGLGAGCGLLLGAVAIWLYDRKTAKEKIQYTITDILESDWNKGDNDLD